MDIDDKRRGGEKRVVSVTFFCWEERFSFFFFNFLFQVNRTPLVSLSKYIVECTISIEDNKEKKQIIFYVEDV